MANQKIEDLLNLALTVPEPEREKSENLNVGYDAEARTWQIVVKYAGDITALASKYPGIIIIPLLGQFAIVTIGEDQLEEFSYEPVVTYIEKSKKLIFSIEQGRVASCINPVQSPPYNLTGAGVLAAVIDSGIDYTHPDFRNEDGTTRIAELWDQTIPGRPPDGFYIGTVYEEDEINRALQASSMDERDTIVPSRDVSGHGTAVAGIMAGNGRASNRVNRGIAPGSSLIVVKLGRIAGEPYPSTTNMMQAIDYVIRRAIVMQMPVVVNISFGSSYGSHDGHSLLESYIDTVSQIWKNNIVIAAGNDAANSGHYSSVVMQGNVKDIGIGVGEYTASLNIQIWKYYGDEMEIEITSPGGSTRRFGNRQGIWQVRLDDTDVLLYYGEPSPYNQAQEIYIELLSVDNYINEGIWNIRLIPGQIIQGNIELWLPTSGILNRNTGFLLPSPELTITIPGTAMNAITVGAYDEYLDYYADFSGRGFIGAFGRVKPDIVAPGVNLVTTAVGGGYTTQSGTSFAAPFVAGSAVLLMEYGIVRSNDVYLYGEKLKALLISGARPLRGINKYPDIRVGFGALCLKNSLSFF